MSIIKVEMCNSCYTRIHVHVTICVKCMYMYMFLYRGCGDTYQLGHGNQDHVRQPKLIEGLSDAVVSDISVGAQHCVALTADSDVYAWGKNSSFEVNESGDIISSPLMIEAASGKGALLIACGASEVCIH